MLPGSGTNPVCKMACRMGQKDRLLGHGRVYRRPAEQLCDRRVGGLLAVAHSSIQCAACLLHTAVDRNARSPRKRGTTPEGSPGRVPPGSGGSGVRGASFDSVERRSNDALPFPLPVSNDADGSRTTPCRQAWFDSPSTVSVLWIAHGLAETPCRPCTTNVSREVHFESPSFMTTSTSLTLPLPYVLLS